MNWCRKNSEYIIVLCLVALAFGVFSLYDCLVLAKQYDPVCKVEYNMGMWTSRSVWPQYHNSFRMSEEEYEVHCIEEFSDGVQ